MTHKRTARETLMHLSLAEPSCSATIGALVEILGVDAIPSIYDASVHEIAQLVSCSLERAQKVWRHCADARLFDRLHADMHWAGVRCITLVDEEYPTILKSLHYPPLVLYCCGGERISLTDIGRRSVACIGTRDADSYGKRALQVLMPDVLDADITIVSTCDEGIAAWTYEEALHRGKAPVAIIASGLGRMHARKQGCMFTAIVEAGGAVISPYPIMMQPLPGNFALRNRLLAALTRMTVVVQASHTCSSSTTAIHADELGRVVGAVPGPVDHPLFAGCHKLLKGGAVLVTESADILGCIDKHMSQHGISPQEQALYNDPILRWCTQPRSFDELAMLSGLSPESVQDRLWQAEIEGVVSRDILGRWVCSV